MIETVTVLLVVVLHKNLNPETTSTSSSATQKLPLWVVLVNQCFLWERTVYNMQNHSLT
jgi:hypothetical protein